MAGLKALQAIIASAIKLSAPALGTKLGCALVTLLLLSACGGKGISEGDSISSLGSSAGSVSSLSSSSHSSSSKPSGASSVATSSAPAQVRITGLVSYEHVPVSNTQGLNYPATTSKAVRLARVNAIDETGEVIATTQTNTAGRYSLLVPSNTELKVQVEAQSFSGEPARWGVRVEDNTAANSLYVLEGQLSNSGVNNSVRDLHATSGWTGNDYTEPRAAAPFAIMDSVYQATQKLLEVDQALSLPSCVLRWSVNNIVVIGDIPGGDIGTSFYDGEAVYLLGQADVDIDEYDTHVITHEWGHFVEHQLSRQLDSVGGEHSLGDKLDMRVAYSEGFANAMAGYLLADPQYRDTLSVSQGVSVGFDVSQTNLLNPGWYNEASIQAVFYHLAESGAFATIYGVLTDPVYVSSPAFSSIFSFADVMAARYPAAFTVLDRLMQQQSITARNRYGVGEYNNGNSAANLPLYLDLVADGSVVTVCSSQQHGSYNKLGVHKYLKTMIFNSGGYRLLAKNNNHRNTPTDPDIIIQGELQRWFAQSSVTDTETLDLYLQSGATYVLSVSDYAEHKDTRQADYQAACFDVSLTPH